MVTLIPLKLYMDVTSTTLHTAVPLITGSPDMATAGGVGACDEYLFLILQ